MAVVAPPLASWRTRWDANSEAVRTVLLVAGVAVAVFGLVATAVALTTVGSHAASWFPAAGVSVGAVAVSHGVRRYAFLVAIPGASLAGFIVGGRPLSLAICFAVACTLEAAMAGHWLSGADRLRLATLWDLGRFLLVTAVAATVGGAVAGAAVWHFVGAQAGQTWLIVAVAHATGALVLLPFVMRVPPHGTALRPWQTGAQSAVVLALTAAVFTPSRPLPLTFIVIVALVWTGLLLGAQAASLQLLVVSGVATLLTVHNRGPFADLSGVSTHQALQTFLLVSTVLVLGLTVAATQRRTALAQVSANERFLDELVETMDVGVLAVDANGAAMLLNRTLRELHGTTDLPDDVFDPRVPQRFNLFRADGVTPVPSAEVPMSVVMTTGQIHDVELTIVPEDQPARNVVVHGRRIQGEDGAVLGGVIAVHDVTALKRHETELEAAVTALADEREFEAAVLEVINAGVVACDADGNVVVRNATQRDFTGVPDVPRRLAAAGESNLQMHYADGQVIPLANSPLHRALAGEEIVNLPVHLAPAGLPEHDVIVTAKAIHGADGRLLGAVSAFTDVTAQLAVQAELSESGAFHDAVLAASPDLIFIVDGQTGEGVWFSRNMEAMLGYSEQAILDMGADTVTQLVHPDDVARLHAGRTAAVDLADGEVQQMRYRIRAPDGQYRWLSRRITPFSRAEDGTLLQLLGVARDVTDAVDIEDRLTDAALHDPLTGLPNRRLLSDRLGLALRRTARSGEELAVLFCDLDGFKNVNDTAGHAAGDRVLIVTADRLRALLRPQDTVARVGGDEFVIILDPSPAASPAPADGANAEPAAAPVGPRAAAALVARRITRALSAPIDVGNSVHVVTVSIGVTFAESDDQPDEVLSDADSAMYKAKSRGKDRVEVYDTALRADAAERGRVERVLRLALDGTGGPGGTAKRGRLAISVAYQPILDLRTQRLIGVEALARLNDAQGLPIGPDVFIPIAEETGLIASLGHFVLTTACNDLSGWHAAHPGWRHLGVSVNLSARQTGRADLVSSVQDALNTAGIAPGLLTLELTESILLEAGRSTLTALREIRALGVKIDIDDFGTGYASLRYLAELPVTGLKIDKSFTSGLPGDNTSQTIVRAIAGLARDLDLTCVAEGIETDAQLLALPSGLAGQGYLLGRPGPAAAIDAWLSADEAGTGAAYRPAAHA